MEIGYIGQEILYGSHGLRLVGMNVVDEVRANTVAIQIGRHVVFLQLEYLDEEAGMSRYLCEVESH